MSIDLEVSEWQDFLRRRSLAGRPWNTERLPGVTNETWRLAAKEIDTQPDAEAYVVRHYSRTAVEDSVIFELAAVHFLASQGFPVADIVPAEDGDLFDHVMGRPCALFEYVSGAVGANLSDTGSQNLAEGIRAARLLARMHRTSQGCTFPGSRTEWGDPIQRLTQWIAQDGSDPEFRKIPGGSEFLSRLAPLLARLPHEGGARSGLVVGLVHGDVAPNNIVVDSCGGVAALLDFDDCYPSYVIFDLCSILWAWGRAGDGQIDPHRVRELVRVYDEHRRLTDEEHAALADLFAVYVAADATGKLTWWWRGEGRPRPVQDSAAARVFLQVTGSPVLQNISK